MKRKITDEKKGEITDERRDN